MEFHWVKESQSVCALVGGHTASVVTDDVIADYAARRFLDMKLYVLVQANP